MDEQDREKAQEFLARSQPRCGPWLCNLPDPCRYPPNQRFHCPYCGSMYRRTRITRQWKITHWGKDPK